MKKGQTATEYLVIVAVVVVIALVVVNVLGIFPSIGANSGEEKELLKYASKKPLSIAKWTAGNDATDITLTNTGTQSIYVDSFETECVNVSVDMQLGTGVAYSFRIPGQYYIRNTPFVIHYYQGSTAYKMKSDDDLSQACTGVLQDVVGYWKMDRNFQDSSVYNNDGQGIDDTYITDGQVVFDGTLDYVDIADDVAFDFGTNPMAVSLWVKTSGYAAHGSVWNAFVASGNLENANQFSIVMASNNRPVFREGFDGSTLTTTIFNDNQWHHIVGVRDATKRYIYVDGVLEDSDAASNEVLTNANGLRIGSDYHVNDIRNINAQIDEVILFNRSLTADEAKSLFDAGKS